VEKNLMTKILKVGVAAAVLALGAGCTDLKPLQAEVDSLKSQVSKLSGDLEGVKTSADGASRAAAAAQQAPPRRRTRPTRLRLRRRLRSSAAMRTARS
jgi:outer membrane murein-binding lipoprotein Lpp